VSDNLKKYWTRWLGIVSLILFGVLVAWDFSAIHSMAKAVIVAIIIAVVFVVVTKLANIEPGWPKD